MTPTRFLCQIMKGPVLLLYLCLLNSKVISSLPALPRQLKSIHKTRKSSCVNARGNRPRRIKYSICCPVIGVSGGYPPRVPPVRLGQGTPLVQGWLGYPPSGPGRGTPLRRGQTENITFPHPSDAVGNYNFSTLGTSVLEYCYRKGNHLWKSNVSHIYKRLLFTFCLQMKTYFNKLPAILKLIMCYIPRVSLRMDILYFRSRKN